MNFNVGHENSSLALTKRRNGRSVSIKSGKFTDNPNDYSFSLLNRIKILVFKGLKPEFVVSNSNRDSGLLLRYPTLPYKRFVPSPVCTNAGSESFWTAKCNRSSRAVLLELHTCHVCDVGSTPVSITDVFRLKMSLACSGCIAGQRYSFGKICTLSSLIHIFHSFWWRSQRTW
jgi:hypothetical protein